MPWSLLLNPKVLGAAAVAVLLWLAFNWHGEQVQNTYNAGYSARVQEEKDEAAKAATIINDVEVGERADVIKLREDLEKARKESSKLSAKIRELSASGPIGDSDFIELYNAGTRAASN